MLLKLGEEFFRLIAKLFCSVRLYCLSTHESFDLKSSCLCLFRQVQVPFCYFAEETRRRSQEEVSCFLKFELLMICFVPNASVGARLRALYQHFYVFLLPYTKQKYKNEPLLFELVVCFLQFCGPTY